MNRGMPEPYDPAGHIGKPGKAGNAQPAMRNHIGW
jgi:hypothetical protein